MFLKKLNKVTMRIKSSACPCLPAPPRQSSDPSQLIKSRRVWPCGQSEVSMNMNIDINKTLQNNDETGWRKRCQQVYVPSSHQKTSWLLESRVQDTGRDLWVLQETRSTAASHPLDFTFGEGSEVFSDQYRKTMKKPTLYLSLEILCRAKNGRGGSHRPESVGSAQSVRRFVGSRNRSLPHRPIDDTVGLNIFFNCLLYKILFKE